MGAYNVVRFRVKPGCEQRFIDAHKKARPAFKGRASILRRTTRARFTLALASEVTASWIKPTVTGVFIVRRKLIRLGRHWKWPAGHV